MSARPSPLLVTTGSGTAGPGAGGASPSTTGCVAGRRHDFQHAVPVAIDADNADREPGDFLGDQERAAHRRLLGNRVDEVLEDAGSRDGLDLPGVSECAADAVGVGDAAIRDLQELTGLRRRDNDVGGGVLDGQRPDRRRVASRSRENDHGVGELQPLDIGEPVGAVGTGLSRRPVGMRCWTVVTPLASVVTT